MLLHLKEDKGFTMLELLVAVAVSTIILVGLYLLLETGQFTTGRGKQKLDIQQSARAAQDTMARDLRMAGSGLPNPVDYPNPPAVFTGATASSLSFLADPFNANTVLTANAAAGATTISVSSTAQFSPGSTIYIYGNDGASPHPANHWQQATIANGGVGANSLTLTSPGLSQAYIAGSQVSLPRTYAYDLQGTTLRRDAGDGNGPQPLAENISGMEIKYYDSADTEINPPSLPAHLNDIRRMEITITAFKADRLRGDQTYVLKSSVRPRNIE
jgi:prepilin-type N-terminal cleavage/methylation domain-containing protein